MWPRRGRPRLDRGRRRRGEGGHRPGSICTTRVISGSAYRRSPRSTRRPRPPGERFRSLPMAASATGGYHQGHRGGSHRDDWRLFAGLAESPEKQSSTAGGASRPIAVWGRSGRWPRDHMNAIARNRNQGGRWRGGTESETRPEGVEGRVPYKGPLSEFVFQLIGAACGMGTAEPGRSMSCAPRRGLSGDRRRCSGKPSPRYRYYPRSS